VFVPKIIPCNRFSFSRIAFIKRFESILKLIQIKSLEGKNGKISWGIKGRKNAISLFSIAHERFRRNSKLAVVLYNLTTQS